MAETKGRLLAQLATNLDSTGDVTGEGLVTADIGVSDAEVIALIDSAYVLSKIGTPSGLTTAQAQALIDSDYVQARVTLDGVGIDSATALSLIDSSYVISKIPIGIDSATALNLIDSDYVSSKITIGIDSAGVLELVDSDYVTARVPEYLTQTEALNLIDSTYVQARVEVDSDLVVASGGSTVYDSISDLPVSGTAGEFVYIAGSNKLFVNSGTAWVSVAVLSEPPTINSITDSDGVAVGNTYRLATDGSPAVITIIATDNDHDSSDLTFDYRLSDPNGAVDSISTSGNVFTITPQSTDSYEGDAIITFRVNDGSNYTLLEKTFQLGFDPKVSNATYTNGNTQPMTDLTSSWTDGFYCVFSPDGTEVIYNYDYGGSTTTNHTNGTVYAATLSTPFDLSSASAPHTTRWASFLTYQQAGTFGPEGEYFWVLNLNQDNSYGWKLSTAYDLSSSNTTYNLRGVINDLFNVQWQYIAKFPDGNYRHLVGFYDVSVTGLPSQIAAQSPAEPNLAVYDLGISDISLLNTGPDDQMNWTVSGNSSVYYYTMKDTSGNIMNVTQRNVCQRGNSLYVSDANTKVFKYNLPIAIPGSGNYAELWADEEIDLNTLTISADYTFTGNASIAGFNEDNTEMYALTTSGDKMYKFDL